MVLIPQQKMAGLDDSDVICDVDITSVSTTVRCIIIHARNDWSKCDCFDCFLDGAGASDGQRSAD